MHSRIQCLCVDTADPARLAASWRSALGWHRTFERDGEVVLEPPGGSAADGVVPDSLFLRVPDGKAGKNRLHLDLRPGDQAVEVARLEGLGASRADVRAGHRRQLGGHGRPGRFGPIICVNERQSCRALPAWSGQREPGYRPRPRPGGPVVARGGCDAPPGHYDQGNNQPDHQPDVPDSPLNKGGDQESHVSLLVRVACGGDAQRSAPVYRVRSSVRLSLFVTTLADAPYPIWAHSYYGLVLYRNAELTSRHE
jgi:Glyoxalase-like domain